MKKFLSNLFLGKIVSKVSINAPFEKVIEALEKAIKNNDFSIPVTHDLKQTFTKANLPLDKDFQYKIVQLCNAKKAHKVLTTMSYDMGIMMPKSIIVARENGQTTLRFMKMKPWMVGMMFPEINIAPMSKNVMATIKKIVDETIKSVEKE
jgi:uncharacterized protein (DUF302 family)